jgi:hypothetical protein
MGMKRGLLGVLLVLSTSAWGKNLDGRAGFGLSYLDLTTGPALSLKFFHTNLVASDFIFGFNTETGAYQLGVKSLRNVVMEENLNLYLGIGGFLVSTSDSTGRATGLEFDALVGGEFFLAGLPNLGFTFEVGIGLRSLRTTGFRTIGGAFASGGIHYYF